MSFNSPGENAHRGGNILLGEVGLSGPVDPFFANVILLLHGDTITDKSVFGHVAAIGGGVTFDNTVPNGTVGASSIRTLDGAAGSTWRYAAANEWRKQNAIPYVLEYWGYLDTVPANRVSMGSTDASKFVQWVTAAPANVQVQGWGSTNATGIALNTWIQYTYLWDPNAIGGARFAQYVNGVQINTNLFALVNDATNRDLDVTSPFSNPPGLRQMEIRITRGTTRGYLATPGATVPVQTAPWPDQ